MPSVLSPRNKVGILKSDSHLPQSKPRKNDEHRNGRSAILTNLRSYVEKSIVSFKKSLNINNSEQHTFSTSTSENKNKGAIAKEIDKKNASHLTQQKKEINNTRGNIFNKKSGIEIQIKIQNAKEKRKQHSTQRTNSDY